MNDVVVYQFDNLELYDYDAIMAITGENRTKIQRVMKRLNEIPVSLKNKHLFTKESVFHAMEAILEDRLKNVNVK
jgi:hypothetical protein